MRVVLLLDSLQLPRWAATSVIQMLQNPALAVVGLVLNGSDAARAGATPRRTLLDRVRNAWRLRNQILLERYLKYDAERYPATGDDPFAQVDLSEALTGVARVTAQPRRTEFSDYLDDAALQAFRALTPDVAVRFGFRILRGDALRIPVHGVWSFHHGDNAVNRGGPPGLWEVFGGWPCTGAILQRLSEDLDGGVTLARTFIATNPISVHQNRIALYRASAPLLIRKLEDLARRGEVAVQRAVGEPPFSAYSNRLFRAPSSRNLVFGVIALLWRLFFRKLWALSTREQWQLAYTFDKKQSRENSVPQAAMFRLKPLAPPDDRFWADPFVISAANGWLVFFEELVFSEGKGRIGVIEFSADGTPGTPRTVLSRPHHLSYPFVFSHDGSWYMYVESSQAGAQELYRATSFPDEWVLDRVLVLGQPVVDPTPLFHDGEWWLFAGTQAAADCPFDELSLFHSASPLGPWLAHPQNPVVTDARRARPAGRCFRSAGALIRPAQDGTPSYGSGIVFHRVARMDREEYVEELITRISPTWNPALAGIHTINASGPICVADVRAVRRR